MKQNNQAGLYMGRHTRMEVTAEKTIIEFKE